MKTNIIICQGSSCFSRGNKENLAFVQKFLRDHNLEGNVTFKGQLCTGNCKESPIIIINGETYTKVDENKISKILTDVFKV